MPLAEIKKFRAQYPQYNDIADQPLAQLLVTKYPQYGDLFGDVANGSPTDAGSILGFLSPVSQAGGAAATAVGEGIKRGVRGLLALPGNVYQGVSRIGELEPGDIRYVPQIAGETAPELIGGAAGSLAGPAGIPMGAGLARGAYALATGQPPQEALTQAVASSVGAAAPIAGGRGLAVVRGAGRGIAGPADASIQGAFERAGVPQTLADVTGGRRAAQVQTALGNLPSSAGVMQGAEGAQIQAMGQSFGRAMQRLGPLEGRALTGQDALAGITGKLKALQGKFSALKDEAVNVLGDQPVIGTDNLRRVAGELADAMEKAHPELQDSGMIAKLRGLASEGTAPTEQPTGLRFPSGEELTRQIPGRDLTRLTFAEWDATQQLLGEASRDPTVIASVGKGRAKQLFRAVATDLEDLAGNPDLAPEAKAAVRRYKDFYSNNIVPFNESLPGRVASGRIAPEDATRLFSKDGLTELQQVKRYTDPELFAEIRNRWLGDLFDKAKVLDPQSGQFQVGAFRRVWNSIDPEVKGRAFMKEQISAFDDLATVAERVAARTGPSMGGGRSGTPAGVLPLSYSVLLAEGLVKAGSQLAAGSPGQGAVTAGAVVAGSLGPYGLARLFTSPGGIRYLTQAYQIPAASSTGLALIGAVAAGRQTESGVAP